MCQTLETLWELIHTKIHTPSVNGNRTAPSALRPQNYSTCLSLLLSSVCSLYWSCVALRRRLTSRLFSHILTECRTLDLCGTWRWVWNCSQHEADEVGFLHLYMSLFGKHWSESVLFVCFFHLVLQSDNAEQGESDSHFLGLVQNLLRDPDERTNFFQVHFGCMLELTQQRWMLNFILLWILCLCPTPVCPVTDIWHLWIYLGSRMFSQEILVPHMTKQSRHWCGCFCPDLRSFFLPKLCNR